MNSFRAVMATQAEGKTNVAFEELTLDRLPPGDLLVKVAYSSLNYKDGLMVTGKPGVVRKWPMVGGIDLAGVVEESSVDGFKPGDRVVVTGSEMSEAYWGGYSQYERVQAEWTVPVPESMSLEQAMAIGTAGFTAMQSVMILEANGLKPGGRDVVVTGAAGGVGSVAIAILAKRGYRVVASSGRAELHEYLKSLGAAEIIGREVLGTPSKRMLEAERWAGAIDSVGGETLSGLLRTTAAHGSIALCGLAGGATFSSTVMPFILRSVNLCGVNSVRVANPERRAIWARLVEDLPLPLLDSMTEIKPISEIFELGAAILAGQIRGRTVIDVNR
ncbi:MAG TPA: MDR family oxidoreductase [Bryobacteraceae bacterium]